VTASDPNARFYPDRPYLAALCVVRRGERVLLAQRSKGPATAIGKWGFPGGMQELGETVEACAQRELLEETGIAAEPRHTLNVINIIASDDDGKVRTHFTLIGVLLDWRAGEGKPIEDATAVGWFTLAEAAKLDTFPDALPMMRLVLESR
jgi:8-oxo-dGTP diphosphatase